MYVREYEALRIESAEELLSVALAVETRNLLLNKEKLIKKSRQDIAAFVVI